MLGEAERHRRLRGSREPTRRPGLFAWIALLPLTALLLGSTCENQDYLEPVTLTLSAAPAFESDAQRIIQPYRGLNTLDIRLSNTGDAVSTFGIWVGVCAGDTCGRLSACDPGDPDTQDGVRCVSRLYELPAGDTIADRFHESELGVGEEIHVEFLCYQAEDAAPATCSGLLDLFLLLRQVECRIDSDCGSSESCDANLGVCRALNIAGEGCRIGGRRSGRGHHVALLTALLLALVGLGAVWRRRAGTRGQP